VRLTGVRDGIIVSIHIVDGDSPLFRLLMNNPG
jgi:hypothetical protein